MDKFENIKKYVGLAIRANHVVIGSENLSRVNKKLYLIIITNDCGKNSIKIVERVMERTSAKLMTITNEQMKEITNIENCKVFGIKNKGLAEKVIELNKE